MIIHLNISILISVLKYKMTIITLSCISLSLVLKFSIAIIHLIFQYGFQDLKTKR